MRLLLKEERETQTLPAVSPIERAAAQTEER
jgi:hypothetical protein